MKRMSLFALALVGCSNGSTPPSPPDASNVPAPTAATPHLVKNRDAISGPTEQELRATRRQAILAHEAQAAAYDAALEKQIAAKRKVASANAVPAPRFTPGPSQAYANQATWYIDPLSAHGTCNDNNTGLTSAAPLCTWNQYRTRVGNYGVATSTVNLMSNLPASDPLMPPRIPHGSFVLVTGTPGATTLLTSAFTSAVNVNAPTNTPTSVTDTSLPGTWSNSCAGSTSCVLQRIRLTSGPNTGATFWVSKDLGGTTARVSQPSNAQTTYFTALTLAGNESFVVESLPTVGDMLFDQPYSGFEGPGPTYLDSLLFEGLDFSNVPYVTATPIAAAGNPEFIGCNIGYLSGAYTSFQSLHGAFASAQTGGKPTYLADLFLGGNFNYTPVYLGLNTIIQGQEIPWAAYAPIQGDSFAIFDGTAGGMRLENATSIEASAIWGSNNTNTAIDFRGPNVGLGAYDGISGFITVQDVAGTLNWFMEQTWGGTWANFPNGFRGQNGGTFAAFPYTPPGPIFNLEVTLVAGTATTPSGKTLPVSTSKIVGGPLLTALNASPAIGAQVDCSISGNNIICTSYTATGAVATTDVATYTVSLIGWN